MDFIIEQRGLVAIIKTNVEKLSLESAFPLRQELNALNGKSINNIIMDMSKTKYCDSSGLGALLLANRLCRDTNGEFVLCGLQEEVQKLITIAQLNRVLSIVKDESAALEIISK